MSWGGDLTVGAPRGAFRPSVIFLCLVALCGAAGAMLWIDFGNAGLNVFLFVLAGWLVSLCLHEYAHAVVAYRGGDRSVAARGYLTLNPLLYSHPLLSVVLPLVFIVMGGLGLPGGAVQVDKHSLRSRWWDSGVSLAGPMVNVVVAVALVAPLALGVDTSTHPQFWAGVAMLAFLQLTVAVLNLLPVPGLDGGNLLFPFLSDKWQRGFSQVAPFGFLVLVGFLFVPEINRVFFTGVFWLGDFVGLPRDLMADGFGLFSFWN